MNSSIQNNPGGPCEGGEKVGKLGRVIAALKERLREDYETRYPRHQRLVRQIVDEAETVAWLTPFPHLFLPDLVEAGVGQKLARRVAGNSSSQAQTA